MDRRQLLIGATMSLGILRSTPGFSQTPLQDDIEVVGELPPLPPDLIASASAPAAPYTETALVGTAPPKSDEIEKAYNILVNSPFGVEPVDIAQYFVSVGAGKFGAEYRSFAREWPVRANPLIFHLFTATQTTPEGDTTAWCAAFINWCLLRSHAKTETEIGRAPGFFSKSGQEFPPEMLKKYSTNNASSGSFRCWNETKTPKRGDIIVLRDKGTDNLTKVCRGSGHVTFYLKALDSSKVMALGGNQSDPGSGGAITISKINTAPGGRFMKYVSIR